MLAFLRRVCYVCLAYMIFRLICRRLMLLLADAASRYADMFTPPVAAATPCRLLIFLPRYDVFKMMSPPATPLRRVAAMLFADAAAC